MATVDRTTEPARFMASLCRQTYGDFELIVVDQNDDARLMGSLAAFDESVDLQHLRSPRGLSRARNAGLEKVRGDIVGFPDDDCLYPPDILERVHRWFLSHPDFDGLSGRSIDFDGNATIGVFDSVASEITPRTIWRRTTSISLFVRAGLIRTGLCFDTDLGAGAATGFGAAEDIDFPLSAMAKGARFWYDPSFGVYHPPGISSYDDRAARRAFLYGGGIGRVLRKHRFPLWYRARALVRPLGGSLLALLGGQPGKARFHWQAFRGRLRGMTA